jgi:hypothetical protein
LTFVLADVSFQCSQSIRHRVSKRPQGCCSPQTISKLWGCNEASGQPCRGNFKYLGGRTK